MEIKVNITYRNDKLQAARKAAGMSQGQLAGAAGISVRVLQDYERGARDLNGARLSTLLKLCTALHCGLEDILTEPETLEVLRRFRETETE